MKERNKKKRTQKRENGNRLLVRVVKRFVIVRSSALVPSSALPGCLPQSPGVRSEVPIYVLSRGECRVVGGEGKDGVNWGKLGGEATEKDGGKRKTLRARRSMWRHRRERKVK